MSAVLQQVLHFDIEKPSCFIDVASHNKKLVRLRFGGLVRSRFYDVNTRHWKTFRKNVKKTPSNNGLSFEGDITFLVTSTKMVEFKYSGCKNGSSHHFPEEILRIFITDIRLGKFDTVN